MKIEPTTLISDAQKISSITQSYYQPKKNDSSKGSQSNLVEKINSIKQQLFTIQSNISAYQTFKEGLMQIHKEIESLNKNNNFENFYEKIFKISKDFSFNGQNIIAKEYLEPLYGNSLKMDDLDDISSNLAQSILELQEKIKDENSKLIKLQVSSENIRAASSIDSKLFKNVKATLDQANSQIMSKVHVLRANEEIGHLLN